jgi:hypothetical protein
MPRARYGKLTDTFTGSLEPRQGEREAHHRDHRCRHTLPGHWDAGASCTVPEDSLLHRLLHGCSMEMTTARQRSICFLKSVGRPRSVTPPS